MVCKLYLNRAAIKYICTYIFMTTTQPVPLGVMARKMDVALAISPFLKQSNTIQDELDREGKYVTGPMN